MLIEDLATRAIDLSLATAKPVREIDPGSASTVEIPDAHLMFQGEYRREGFDLVIEDERSILVVNDYFRAATRPVLETADGARLTGDVVGALAVSDHGERYAQATPPAPQAVIGRVETVSGQATVIRNGAAVVLNQGDVVLKGDVVQTDRGSSLGITFVDGSTFSLGSGARMVLNDMVYQQGGTQNSALLNIVQGSVTFLAGQVAKSGEMRVGTPVATMGIRGTLVNAEINSDNGQVRFSVLREPNGEVGRYDLIRDGRVIATVSSADTATVVTPSGIVSTEPKSFDQQQAEQLLVQQIFQIVAIGQANPLIPGTGPAGPALGGGGGGGGGSSTDPNLNNNTLPSDPGNPIRVPDPSPPNASTVPQNLTPGTTGQPPVASIAPTQRNPNDPAGGSPVPGGSDPTNGTPPANGAAPGQDLSVAPQTVGLTEDELAAGDQGSLLGPGGVADGQRVVAVRFGSGAELPVAPGQSPTTISGQYGTLAIGENGAYSYAPLRANALAEGERASETFTYVVRDASGRLASTTVTFDILGENDAPTVSAPVAARSLEGSGANSVDLLAGATDVDHGATLRVENLAWTGQAAGQLPPGFRLSSDGHSLAVSGDDPAYDALSAGETRSFTFTFEIVDEHGARVPQTATVVVTGTNDPAVISGTTTGSVVEASAADPGQPLATGTLTAQDVDGPANSFQANSGTSGGGYGAYAIDAAGQWTYTLDNANATVQALNNGETLLDTFVVRSADGTAQTISVTINGATDTPTGGGTGGGTNHPPLIDLSPYSDRTDVGISYGSYESGISITDNGYVALSDSDGNPVQRVRVSLGEGARSGDELSAYYEGPLTITGFDDGAAVAAGEGGIRVDGSGSYIEFSGSGSYGDFAEAINSVRFTAEYVYGGQGDDIDRNVSISVLADDGLSNGTASAVSTVYLGNSPPQAVDDLFSAGTLGDRSAQTPQGVLLNDSDPDLTPGGLRVLSVRSHLLPPDDLSGLTATAQGYYSHDHNFIDGLGGSIGLGDLSLDRNDDDSSSLINIVDVFGSDGLRFFGETFTGLYVNNNGNITFKNPSGDYTPDEIGGSGQVYPIIAPFWYDVDTRNVSAPTLTNGGNSKGTNLVYYDLDSANRVLTVTWDDVGYFDRKNDLINAFQLQLIDRSGSGDFDIIYRYEDLSYGGNRNSSESSSDSSARAGYSAGNGGNNFFELPQSGDYEQMITLDTIEGNTGQDGVWLFQVRNGQVANEERYLYNGSATVQGQFGSLTLYTNGSYEYVANSSIPSGATDTFEYTVADGAGASDKATLTIQVTAPNTRVTGSQSDFHYGAATLTAPDEQLGSDVLSDVASSHLSVGTVGGDVFAVSPLGPVAGVGGDQPARIAAFTPNEDVIDVSALGTAGAALDFSHLRLVARGDHIALAYDRDGPGAAGEVIVAEVENLAAQAWHDVVVVHGAEVRDLAYAPAHFDLIS